MVFSKPEGTTTFFFVFLGFTKYHRSRWTQSLACLGYGQYTDMFTCISTYKIILYKNQYVYLVRMYTEGL